MFSSDIILSAYNNPPYRNPISRNISNDTNNTSGMAAPSSVSIPEKHHHNHQSNRHSPKRKRPGTEALSPRSHHHHHHHHQGYHRALTPELTPVTVANLDISLPSGAISPRSKVVEHLKELNLQQRQQQPLISSSLPQTNNLEISSPGSSNGKAISRKRLKREWNLPSSTPPQIPQHPTPLYDDGNFLPDEIDEINETPYCRQRSPSLRSRSTGLKLERFSLKDSVEIHGTDRSTTGHFHRRSPPPPAPAESEIKPRQLCEPAAEPDHGMSPLSYSEDMTPDKVALTWQDDEITGHEIDMGGDDDGEGINGIGFKPTPAQAYVRQQRRKQQVNDWKAREAREARQRRVERRRGSSITIGIGQSKNSAAIAKRVVRFAEVG